MLPGIMMAASHLPSMMLGGSGCGTPSMRALGEASNMFDDQQSYQNHHDLMATQAMPEAENFGLIRDEDFASTPGSEPIEAPSGDEQDQNPGKRKRYHRHTTYQIERLESFFKECPHPDDKQRKELSRELGLEPLQVKFWFQNKRTQVKNQHERRENYQLREDNERLRGENQMFKEALSSTCCPNCGGPASIGEVSFDEQQLRLENARLREEIGKMTAIAAKYVGGNQMIPYLMGSLPGPSSTMDPAVGEFEVQLGMANQVDGPMEQFRPETVQSDGGKPLVFEMAIMAMEELMRMVQIDEPLWVASEDGSSLRLNEEEYLRVYSPGLGPKLTGGRHRTEASRETALVRLNHLQLVRLHMDVDQWATFFASIVSTATKVETYSSGVGASHDGALLLISAEFFVPSPLVPVREPLLLRYCKQHAEGLWAIVDVAMDLRHNFTSLHRRRPSGCLIQEMPNGYSKIVWVEHVEYDDEEVHDMYKPIVNSGIPFGAKRWVGTMVRQGERISSVLEINNSTGFNANPDGKKSVLKLVERMLTYFSCGANGTNAHQWIKVSGSGAGVDDVRIMSRKSSGDRGRPLGIILNATTSFWLPVQPKRIFDFLQSENSRNEVFRVPEFWDMLTNGGNIQEVAQISNGQEQGTSVSILRVCGPANENRMMIVQESCFDVTGSYVVYAPIDVVDLNLVLSGGDPDFVALLPSGFAILPDGPPGVQGGLHEAHGSLVTVSFQILVDSRPEAKISLGSIPRVDNLISSTCERIKLKLL